MGGMSLLAVAATLLAPSFEKFPHARVPPVSDAEYNAKQEIRKVFKRKDTSPLPRVMQGPVNPETRDEPGFAAAGVFLWGVNPKSGRVEVLMAWEDRWPNDSGPPAPPDRKLNFLGGCRDEESQTPRQVAIREMEEESGEELSGDVLPLLGDAVWVPECKYWLFIQEVDRASPDFRDPALRRFSLGNFSDMIVGIRWVDCEEIMGPMDPSAFHEFAMGMVDVLHKEKAFPPAFLPQ